MLRSLVGSEMCIRDRAGWMKLVLGTEVGLSPGDFVLDGDPVSFSPKGAEPPPQFSAHFYCGQTAGCIKMPLGMDVGLSTGDFVFDGEPVPLPGQGGKFSAHVYCGQTAGWIKMPLGTNVGLRPGGCVLDGDPAPFPKRRRSPQFSAHGPCLLWPNRCMDQDGTWHGGGPWSVLHCARWLSLIHI